jgi:23S rRNA pseudouridine2605 synthase
MSVITKSQFVSENDKKAASVPMTSRRPPRSAPRSAPADAPRGRRAARVAAPPRDPKAEPEREDGPQRIAKLLARAGVGSRRDVERMIEEGRIALNGETVAQPAPLLTSLDGLTVDGQPVAKPVSTRLYRFHKPAGCLTAARDPKGRKTIYDLLSKGLPRLMPVGRLDYNTEGLLLLTNDGEFKRQLELPASGVERTYRARAFGDISQTQLEDLVEGIEIDGIRYGKIDANLERRTGRNQWIEMTLTEGKNREVRRVLEHLGLQVSRLIRTRYGQFTLEGLDMGGVEIVPRDELFQFRRRLDK